jgi:hypothetical protein
MESRFCLVPRVEVEDTHEQRNTTSHYLSGNARYACGGWIVHVRAFL